MQPRKTIFDSHSEEEVFKAIAGTWEPKFKLYPHVPFANLVDLSPHELDAAEISFLHKTSVDFVLTTRAGTPLLGIEFDGLSHGHSMDGSYVQGIPSRDASRAWKLDLKVRVATGAGLAFLVFSYDEKVVLEESTNLIVAHAIVGQFLANWHTGERINELYEEAKDWLDALPADEKQEQIQDLVIGAEIDTSMEWNPVARRAGELWTQLYRLDQHVSIGYSYEQDPPRPDNTIPYSADFDPAAFDSWWTTIKRVGCRYTITTSRGAVTRTVWIRNLGSAFSPYGFLDDMAELVTAQAALGLYSGDSAASSAG